MQFNRRWEFPVTGKVNALDISPDGKYVLAGTAQGQVVMLARDGNPVWNRKINDQVYEVRCGTNGEWAVVLTKNGLTLVLDVFGDMAWQKELKFTASAVDLRAKTNMIMLGNRYRFFRQVSVFGKVISRGEVPHPIDFIRFAPGGRKCAVACASGHVTMLGYKGERLWTSFLHRMILGVDVAEKASFIIAPSMEKGIVALDMDGNGQAVYEMRDPILAAETDDLGERIVALDNEGFIVLLERDARVLARQRCGYCADLLALDGSGRNLALAGLMQPGESVITCMALSSKEDGMEEFLELRSKEKEEITDNDVSTDYIEVD